MEEQQPQNHVISPSSSSSSPPPSPSPVSQVAETEETEVNVQQQQQQQQPNYANPRSFAHRISQEWNDAWCCLLLLLTFCCFASITMILGFYGSFNLQLGPNSSYLIEGSSIFVRNIKIEQTGDETVAPMLYGFHKSPSLDVQTIWSQNFNASVLPYLYKEWTYYLNAGSRIDIAYDVKFSSSAPLFLVIAESKESLLKWIEDPSYPNTTLCWKIIYGLGQIVQNITTSDTYYVAVGNLNSDTTVVDLNITVHSLMYNTSNAYYECSLGSHICRFRFHLFKPNSAIITSPQVEAHEDWYVQVSFGAQWASYICGSCIITTLVLVLFRLCNLLQSSTDSEATHQATENGENQEPLLSPKGDVMSSWGSSYDSLPDDDEDVEAKPPLEGYPEGGKVPMEGEAHNQLCNVCFDAPRDCFFLPCGHCATCFSCGLRIAEEAGSCPICRRNMKKVRKIFAV